MSKSYKVVILTQPLKNNFGGNLQAFALQKVISGLNIHVETINYTVKNKSIFHEIKNSLKKNLGLKYKEYLNTQKSVEKREKKHINFLRENMILSPKIYNSKKLHSYIEKQKFDTIIVGSDQVWRPLYSINIRDFFVDFTNKSIKKISYAASFGVDTWEYSLELTNEFKSAINKFQFISVRETSGLELCSNNLDVKAKVVLDPTLLLEKQVYIDLFKDTHKKNNNKYLFSYLLDNNTNKESILQFVNSKLNLQNKEIINPNSYIETPSIEDWLSSIYYSDFVITDSFHGAVFSIIFQKDFLVVLNKERGSTRFISLLKILNLEDRIIYSNLDIDAKLKNNINYVEVEKILHKEIKKSLQFLEESLLK